MHWHQPHTWSEITRAGLAVDLSADADIAGWFVGDERREGTIAERDAIAQRGWDQFVDGVDDALPAPYDPLLRIDLLERFDRLSVTERMAQLDLDDEEHDVLAAELESVVHGPLDDGGAVSILRWHQLSGGSLKLTQYTGGRVTLPNGHRTRCCERSPVAPSTRRGSRHRWLRSPKRASGSRCTPARGRCWPPEPWSWRCRSTPSAAIAFEPGLSPGKRRGIALGQASRGIKIFIRARGPRIGQNTIRPGHEFGYLDTEILGDDGTQIMIGFGLDAAQCDATDLRGVQQALDRIIPGYEVLDATANDWLADEFSQGTWAIHRPGWYSDHHAEMRRPEGRVLLAGSDVANGWAGFIDGAIESGLRAGAWARTAAGATS